MLGKLVSAIGFVCGVAGIVISTIPVILVLPLIKFTNTIGILDAETAMGMTKTLSDFQIKMITFLTGMTKKEVERVLIGKIQE